MCTDICQIKISTKSQKKQLNGKGGPTKTAVGKAKPTPAKPAKSGSYKLVVKAPMPPKAARSTTAKPKARPTAVEILLSKINPTTTYKFTTSTVRYSTAKSATAKTNGLAKASNNNGNGKAAAKAKANGNGKAEAKPTAQARLNGNGRVVVQKKVMGSAKTSAEKKSGANGKVTVVTKSSVTVEKKATGNGRASTEVKEIKMKVNRKPENKVVGEAKASGNAKIITVVEKKVTNGAASRAKMETTTRAKTEKVLKVEKIEKTVLSTAKSAAKPTKATKFESTTLTKATKAAGGRSQARSEVKEASQVRTATTKVPPGRPTLSKAAKNVVEAVALPRKVASTSTSVPVRPTPPRPLKPKMATEVNVKSNHKPFPPFGKTFPAIPARKVTNGYQQVLRSVWPLRPSSPTGPAHHSGRPERWAGPSEWAWAHTQLPPPLSVYHVIRAPLEHGYPSAFLLSFLPSSC